MYDYLVVVAGLFGCVFARHIVGRLGSYKYHNMSALHKSNQEVNR